MVSLEIGPVADAGHLPACTPSLMPFHISYSGLAPISRYFRPKPAPPSTVASVRSTSFAAPVESSSISILSETESNLKTMSSTTSLGNLAHESEHREDELLSKTRSPTKVINQVEQVTAAPLLMDSAMGMDCETQPASGAVPLDISSRPTHVHTPAPRNVERFLAAFRGRQLYGQAVDIPVGYSGLVLRAPLDSKGKGKEDAQASSKPLSQKARAKARVRPATRWSKRATVDDVADEPEGGDDCCPDADADPSPLIRTLIPSSMFSSFMLWTPDRPLDEGSDEYARALVEWTRLATEIHSYDE